MKNPDLSLPKILIIDDEQPACTRLTMLLEDIAPTCPHELLGVFHDAQNALDFLLQHQVDIVLLDIQMPTMTGLELAQHLHHLHLPQKPYIIFITAYDEYAVQAFEVNAIDYLLKPIRSQRLQEALEKALNRLNSSALKNEAAVTLPASQHRQHFSVVEKNRVLLIPIHEVLFLKAEQKYVTIQTREKGYLTEESLVSIESELGELFVRVHRNALVARNAITGVEKATYQIDDDGNEKSESWQVIVRDSKERLPISRRQWPSVKALIKR